MNEFRDISATLGVDFQIKQLLVDGEQTTLQIWDTAGQERYRSIAQSYFRKAHGVLLLYDISSQSSFISIRQWIEDIKVEERIRQPPWGRAAALGKAVLSPTWCCGSSTKPAPAGPFVEQSLGAARPWGAPGTKRAEPRRGCSSQAACPSHELPLAPAGC
uniref:Ras-related protein Rab-43 n=1 Tax=Anas platyrhynchos TaxID=8839 RepID=A0A8B9TEY9_ANAPL